MTVPLALLKRIAEDGVVLRIGLLRIGLRIQEPSVAREVFALYDGYQFDLDTALPDFWVDLKAPNFGRRILRKRLQIYIDHKSQFRSVPPSLGVPILESAINWYLGNRLARYLLIHGAVVERAGDGIVLSGPSGAGKSTLAAALIANGWRLLSDEATIVVPKDGSLLPHPRPISLKNDSIDLIGSRYPQLAAENRYEGTTKGTVAFVQAPREAVEKANCAVKPLLVIALKYRPGLALTCERLEKANAFSFLVRQSPNYAIMLERGFHTLANFVETTHHFRLEYSNFDEAVEKINELSTSAATKSKAA